MGYSIYHSQYTAAQIEASIGKTPRIKAATRTWEIWDIATSAYVDTGVSIDTQLFVDPTLTESGYAADAKVTGDKLGELKSALGHDEDLGTGLLGTFENGSLDNDGVPYSSGYQYRVRNTGFIPNGNGKRVIIANGFRITVMYYNSALVSSGAYAASSGWKTGEYTIGNYPFYKVIIARVTENTSETADVAEFTAAVRTNLVDTVLANKAGVAESKSQINSILQIIPAENPGYIGSNGSISSPSTAAEKYTDKIPVSSGDTVSFDITWADTSSSKWVAVAYYSETGAFLSRTVLTNANTGHYETVIVIPDNVGYISFTYRTYNSCDTNIYRLNSLNQIVDAIRNQLSSMDVGFVKSINHRGYNTVAPENTLPAYRLSKQKGFPIVETDVSYTSDNVPVLLHDNTINRTARNSDGSTISSTINIADITYTEALTYDFGIWKGEQYAGTKIPTFEEFIALCRNLGLKAYVELKNTGPGYDELDRTRAQGLVDIVKSYGMSEHITWISDTVRLLGYISDHDSTARLGYVVTSITQTIMTNLASLIANGNEAFLDSSSYTSDEIALCKTNNIPLEIWTINSAATIAGLNGYVSGVTSDSVVAGQILYASNI